MRFTGGKFSSLKDEVVWRASMDGCDAETGSVQDNGTWYGRLDDFYGLDYIVSEDSQGFVTVEVFEHIAIDNAERYGDQPSNGYYCPTDRRWAEIEAEVSAWYSDEEDEEGEEGDEED